MAPGKILIVKPSSLGDIVHSLPVLNALSKTFPDAVIDWVIAHGFEGLLEGHPMIRKLWIIRKDNWKKIRNVRETVQSISVLFKQLKGEQYDVVIDLQGLLRSGLIASATASPMRIGLKEAREGSRVFYTHTVEGGKNGHAVDRYLKIAGFLGCDISDVRFPLPPTGQTSFPQVPEKYAVLVPGARWGTKLWPAEEFGKLASALPMTTLVIGGRADTDIANVVVSLSGGKARSLAGETDIKDLIEILRRAQFVVSNDSGPMHIAAALAIPVFAIFGPTDPRKTGPYGGGHTIIRSSVPCAPCRRKSCEDARCMKEITARNVYDIIAATLSRERPKGGTERP